MQNLSGYSENAVSDFLFFIFQVINKSNDTTIMQLWPETY